MRCTSGRPCLGLSCTRLASSAGAYGTASSGAAQSAWLRGELERFISILCKARTLRPDVHMWPCAGGILYSNVVLCWSCVEFVFRRQDQERATSRISSSQIGGWRKHPHLKTAMCSSPFSLPFTYPLCHLVPLYLTSHQSSVLRLENTTTPTPATTRTRSAHTRRHGPISALVPAARPTTSDSPPQTVHHLRPSASSWRAPQATARPRAASVRCTAQSRTRRA